MTRLPGRPALPGQNHSITIRLTRNASECMTAGAQLIADKSGKAISKAAWFRLLIDKILIEECVIPGASVIDLDVATWSDALFTGATEATPVKISDAQKIALRKLEFRLQSIDWQKDIFRNEACLILIEKFGHALNTYIALGGDITPSR